MVEPRGAQLIEKFGKSFLDILGLKQTFFEENDALLARVVRHAEVYARQPPRTACKACATALPDVPSLRKSGIDYALCDVCGHLNGLHEDTDAYSMEIYAAEGGAEYAEHYSSADVGRYEERRDRIYVPKVDFLFEVLTTVDGLDPTSLRFADMGAGAGYFIHALRHRGVQDAWGYELGETLLALGNWIMEDRPISPVELGDIVGLTRTLDADLVSFIGVFEHLQDLRWTLEALAENERVRYLYTSVPMFSPTVFNEMAFPEVMPRHLSGGHTHLFTRSSLDHLEREFGLERIGVWWFGTDLMDYYRSVAVTLAASSPTADAVALWAEMFAPLVDAMQLAMDQARASSQVHLVYRCHR